MKNKNKIVTIGVVLVTLLLAGVAVFTAVRLYQTRNTSVSPSAPESKPKAAGDDPPVSQCQMTFVISAPPTLSPTPSPTGTGTPTASPTPTPTNQPTLAPTATPNSCGGTCGSNFNCNSDLVCYNGFCRNPSCTGEADCVCNGTPGPTTIAAGPTAAPPTLPESGTDWPTMAGVGLGILVILGSLLLAL